MQANINTLSKKAIDAALKNDWDTAIALNTDILERSPKDKNAKIRLGRAYINTKEFSKAKKIFEEVLEIDPINKVALKNHKLASDKKTLNNNGGNGSVNHTKALIKEPGTTEEVTLKIAKKVLEKLEPGQELTLRSAKTKLTFLLSDKKTELGFVSDSIAKAVYEATQNKFDVHANVATTNKEEVTILLKCKKPIFKSRKQQESPYMKKGLIEEPELEIPDHADADTDDE